MKKIKNNNKIKSQKNRIFFSIVLIFFFIFGGIFEVSENKNNKIDLNIFSDNISFGPNTALAKQTLEETLAKIENNNKVEENKFINVTLDIFDFTVSFFGGLFNDGKNILVNSYQTIFAKENKSDNNSKERVLGEEDYGVILNANNNFSLTGENQLRIDSNGTIAGNLNAFENKILINNGSSFVLADLVSSNHSLNINNENGSIDIISSLGVKVDISSETNLKAGDGLRLEGDSLRIASSIARDSELHEALTLSGEANYLTLVGQDIVRNLIDLTAHVSGVLPIANGGTGVGDGSPIFNNLTATGTITAGSFVGSFSGGFAPNGDVDMLDNLMVNIGNAGTDFNSLGGLTLANTLIVSTGGANIAGVITATGGNSTNWNSAYAWGNHASVGYLTASSINTLTNKTWNGNRIDISDYTNLFGDTEIVLTGDSLSIAASITRDSELHSAVTVSGQSYLSLLGQAITTSQINLVSHVTGTLGVANGGTGVTSLNDLIALGTHTTGNYINNLTSGTGISITGTAGEGWSPTVGITNDSIGDIQLTFNTGQNLTTLSSPIFVGLNLTGLTSGSIIFQGASGLTQDNANIFWDDVNNRLGIGTTNPIAKLDIRGVNSDVYAIAGSTATDGNLRFAGLRFDRSNNVVKLGHYMNSGLIERGFIAINNDGNVGIGTTTPGAKLDVSGSVQVTNGQLNIFDTINDPRGVSLFRNSLNLGGFNTNGNHVSFYSNSGYDLRFTVNSSALTAMTIKDVSGNVGIGTTNPDQLLTIKQSSDIGGMRMYGSTVPTSYFNMYLNNIGNPRFESNGSMVFDTDTYGSGGLYFRSGGDMFFNDSSAKSISFNNGQVYIASSGRVGIGTTSPARLLHLNGSAGNTYLMLSNDNTGHTTSDGFQVSQDTDGNAFFINRENAEFRMRTNDMDRITIQAAGNVGIGTTTPDSNLQIYSSTNASLNVGSNGTGDYASIIRLTGESEVDTWFGGYLKYNATGNNFALGVHRASDKLIANDLDAIVISRTTGNVGIGTNTPGYKLDIGGDANVSGTLTVGTLSATNLSSDSAISAPYFTATDALGTSSFAGGINIAGNIIPMTDNTYSLGSATNMWKDVYIGPGSLYINGKKVIEEASESMVFSADLNQNLIVQTSGSGDIEFNPLGTGVIQLKGNVQLTAGKTFRTSTGVPLNFSDGILASNLSLTGNLLSAANTNGSLELSANGLGAVYVTTGNFGIGTTGPLEKLDVAGRVHLAQTTAPGTTTDRLYNVGGSLYWNGTNISSGGTGATQWTTSGSDIYYNSGNVGIGTINPLVKLDVQGAGGTGVQTAISVKQLDDGSGHVGGKLSLVSSGWGEWGLYVGDTSSELNRLFYGSLGNTNFKAANSTATNGISFNAYDKSPLVRINNNGNVGIGTASPEYKLQINSSGSGTYPMLISGSSGSSLLSVYDNGGNGQIILKKSDYSNSIILNATGDSYFNGGNVGIGTTAPGERLEVNGNIKLTNSGNYLQIDDVFLMENSNQAYLRGADGMQFQLYDTDWVSKMVIDNSGNVGIGTTSPTFKLDVDGTISSGYGNGNGEIRMYQTNGAIEPTLYVSMKTDTTLSKSGLFRGNVGADGFYAYYDTGTGDTGLNNVFDGANIVFGTNIGGTLGERMRIQNNGNVGIGTTSPSNKLSVEGIISSGNGTTAGEIRSYQIDSYPSYYISLKTDTVARKSGLYRSGFFSYFDTNTADVVLDAVHATAGSLMFKINGAEKMRVDRATGSVGIGTTSPEEKLDVVGNIKLGDDNEIYNSGGAIGRKPFRLYSTTDKGILDLERDGIINVRVAAEGNSWLNGTGNVGIGATNPLKKLHITGTGIANKTVLNETSVLVEDTEGLLQFVGADTGSYSASIVLTAAPSSGANKNWGLIASGPDYSNMFSIGYATGINSVGSFEGSRLFNITTAGNVGIGTTSPSSKLHISGGNFQIGESTMISGNPYQYFYGYDAATSSAKYGRVGVEVDGSFNIQAEDSYLVLGASSYVQIQDTALLLEGMFMRNNKPIKMQNTEGSFKDVMILDGSNLLKVGAVGSTWTTGGEVAVFTGGLEKMRITNTGNVGIGTTSPTSRLHGVTTLSADTGNEVAYQLNYTTNKLAGNDTGLLINMTDTASPGSSVLLDLQIGGVSRGYFSNGEWRAINAVKSASNTPLVMGVDGSISVAGKGQVLLGSASTFTGTSGDFYGLKIVSNYNQAASTASNVDLLINRTETAIGSGAQYLIDAQVGGVSKFNVTNTGNGYFAGNVGIGTTSPSELLHLSGGNILLDRGVSASVTRSLTIGGAQQSAGTDYARLDFRNWDNNDVSPEEYVSARISSQNDTGAERGDLRFYTYISGSLNERVIIGANGNMGIGTTSPASKLHVSGGEITLDNSYYYKVKDVSGVSRGIFTISSSDNTIVQSPLGAEKIYLSSPGNYMSLIANNVEGIRINSSGNVGIGTTSPGYKLEVNGDGYFSTKLGIGTATDSNGNASTLAINTRSGEIPFSIKGNIVPTTTAINTITNISPSFANTVADGRSLYGMYINPNTSGSTFGINNFEAGRFYAYPKGIVNISNAYGFDSKVSLQADYSGTVTNAYGFYSNIENSGTGTLTNGYGAFIGSPYNNGGGSFLNNYGLYISDQSAVGSTSSFNLYSAGTNSKNYFAGNVGIGTISPTAQLHLVKADSSALTDFLVNPTVKTSGYLMDLQVGGSSKFRVTFDGALISNYIYADLRNSSDWNNATISPGITGTLIKRQKADENPTLVVHQQNASSTGDILQLKNSASTVFTVQQNGNVGIGTTSPTSKLTVYNEGSSIIRNYAGANGISSFDFFEGTPTVDPDKDGFRVKYDGANNALKIHAVDTQIEYETRGITILRNTGNVGIGTTSPAEKLDVAGSIKLSNEVRAGSGSVTYNAFSFGGDADTGMYRPVADNIGLTTGGVERIRIDSAGNIGIGTTSPTYALDVRGASTTSGVNSQAGYNINLLAAPVAPTGSLASGTNLGIGQYYYFVTYVTAMGETSAGSYFAITTTSGNQAVNLSIPVSSDPRVTARKIYRTKVDATSDNEYYLATVSDNSTTSYSDTIADASLTGVGLQYYKINTTSKYITTAGVQSMIIDKNLVALGLNAGNDLITNRAASVRTVLIGDGAGERLTTGYANVIVGKAGGNLTTGGSNSVLGDLALYGATSYSSGVAIGSQTARFMNSGSASVFIGGNAGNKQADGVTNLTSSNSSIYIGYNAKGFDNSDSNSIVIGAEAIGLGANTAVLGNSSIAKTALFGNVGIGTTSPGAKLNVVGTISTTDGTNGYMTMNTDDSATKTGYLEWRLGNGTRLGFMGDSTTNIALALENSANFVVNGGNVGIGTTSPGAKLDIGLAGTSLGTLRLAGNTSGYIQIQPSAAAGSWTMTLPGAVGGAGQQLTDVNGDGITSWAAAGSLRSLKNIDSQITDPNAALNQIVNTSIYNFHYKKGMGTGDSNTQYVGVMADEASWAMHYDGNVINPVNTLGYMVLGVKALDNKINLQNQNITETQSITSLLGEQNDVQTQNFASVLEATESHDLRIANSENKLDELNVQTQNITSLLQEQIVKLEELSNQELNFAWADLFASILDIDDATGTVNILNIKDFSAEVTETGMLVIKVNNNEDATIGTAVICPALKELDENGKCEINQVDENNDGLNDGTGNAINNGKKITVKTGAVKNSSKVFVTIKSKLTKEATLMVTDINENESFDVELVNPTEEDVTFDWWIVEMK